MCYFDDSFSVIKNRLPPLSAFFVSSRSGRTYGSVNERTDGPSKINEFPTYDARRTRETSANDRCWAKLTSRHHLTISNRTLDCVKTLTYLPSLLNPCSTTPWIRSVNKWASRCWNDKQRSRPLEGSASHIQRTFPTRQRTIRIFAGAWRTGIRR